MSRNCLNKQLHYLLITVFLFGAATVSGQGFYNTVNWRFSNPQKFGFTVLDVDFFDNNNVIAVGSDGGIAKSTDGGANWSYGPFTFLTPAGVLTKTSFSDVHYITANIAYAVGAGGCMAKTTDGGISWSFVTTPLRANSRNINTCWFLNKDTGYIGGQFNTADSIPKLYVTRNGGSTWDSLSAPPQNGVTRVGYINNPNISSVLYPVNAKAKEIFRIQFLNDSVGYVCGQGSPLFPPVSQNAVAATCLPGTGTLTTGAHTAALLWKFSKGVLTDYSISKERLGYTGINVATITCTSGYGNITPAAQTYRAMNIINDSLIVMMSFNNNTVVRVRTGRNDSTANVNAPGVFEKGKFEVLNYPFPPTAGPNAGPPIPPVQNLLASNPYQMLRNTAGTLVTGSFSNISGPGYLWTSADTGRTWTQRSVYPQGRNWSPVAAAPSLDFSPGGKLLVMGNNGVSGDSTAGGTWQSNYLTVPVAASYFDIDFADCNNGMAAGGGSITVTTDGGATWTDRFRPDIASAFASINGVAYVTPAKAYLAVSNGILYRTPDKAVTLDPVYAQSTFSFNDVAAIGNDSVWVVGYNNSTIAAASRTSQVFRSFNNGNTWQAIGGFPVGSPAAPILSRISFPSRQVGYVAGSQGAIYKTTNSGTTWTDVSPFPALTPKLTYTEVFALDDNTVFACGNGFPRKAVYKSTDGGATWTDITSNILTIYPVGNLNGILMHDANNGYVAGPGGALLVTNNGGTSWRLDLAPTGSLFETMAFAPRTVPAGISMNNRKLFVCGANLSGAPMMEYGNPASINVNTTETVVNTNCSAPNGGSITVNATGGIPPYSYSINGGPFQAGNTFTGLSQGPKTIEVRDAFCGKLVKTVNISFTDNLTLTTSNDTTVCAGAPVPLVATSAATSYTWSPAAGLGNPGISNPTAIVQNNTAYTVTASLNGCVRTATINISIRPNPVISAGPDKTIVEGDAVQLDGAGNPNSTSVVWTPAATLTGANTYTPVAKPGTTTVYTITVRDANGCTSTDDARVIVIPYCIKVMNAFSPNGDGINDKWLVTNGAPCASQIITTVFNRYGSPVYKNNNYQNTWDGTYNGKPVPDGTYYYAVTYRLISGREITVKGDVTILR